MSQKKENPWANLVKVREEQDSPLSVKSKVDQWYEELIDEPASEAGQASAPTRRDGPLKTTAD